jgi:AraC-like DNA-binding protein
MIDSDKNEGHGMGEIYYVLNTNALPQVSALDSCGQRPPYVHFKRKYHEYILYVITSGELFLNEEGIEYHLEENDCILLDPTRTHVGIRTSSYTFCYFHFLPGYAGNRYMEVDKNYLLNQGEVLFPKIHRISNDETIKICRELCDRVHDISVEGGFLKRQKASALLHMIMLEISEDARNQEHGQKYNSKGYLLTAKELERYIKRHYMDDFDSEGLGDKFGYNYDHLNRLFKKETGSTIYRYLVQVRCEEAQKLLQTGYYSNEEIAARVGFAGSDHLSHVYKKIWGYPPSYENRKTNSK